MIYVTRGGGTGWNPVGGRDAREFCQDEFIAQEADTLLGGGLGGPPAPGERSATRPSPSVVGPPRCWVDRKTRRCIPARDPARRVSRKESRCPPSPRVEGLEPLRVPHEARTFNIPGADPKGIHSDLSSYNAEPG